MAERPDFQQQQLAFAAHIRDPDSAPAPAGIEDRRLEIYRTLFLNNLASLLASTFPVLRKLHDETAWKKLIRGFMRTHESHTPLFMEVPREFVDYLQAERAPEQGDLPFLSELAHYEWVELALSIADDVTDDETIRRDGDLLSERPVVSPLAWPLVYKYPVHRISVDFQPASAPSEPSSLVVYRQRNDALGFLEINVATARVLQLLDETGNKMSGRQVLETVAAEIGHPDVEAVVRGGHDTLLRMQTLDIILGTRTV